MNLKRNPLTIGRFKCDRSSQILTLGRFLGRTRGAYAIYVIQYSELASLTTARPWTYAGSDVTSWTFKYPWDANSSYAIGVSAINECGGLESSSASWFTIYTDASGVPYILPRLPSDLTVTAQSYAKLLITWKYNAGTPAIAADDFLIELKEYPTGPVIYSTTEAYVSGSTSYSKQILGASLGGVFRGLVRLVARLSGVESRPPLWARYVADGTAPATSLTTELVT